MSKFGKDRRYEGYSLGGRVGYRVRDDDRSSSETEILFATPGVVLRMMCKDPKLDDFQTLIIDEFHERSLDTDLICALARAHRAHPYILMSATMDADRLAAYVDGPHIHAPGRVYEVSVEYLGQNKEQPSPDRLAENLVVALERVDRTGHVLVFLPGKREIQAAFSVLTRHPVAVVRFCLHGGLSLKEQSRVFAPSSHQKVVLTTNVAETSLTVPGVRWVVDSGLVRQTRYRAGRGYLTLCAVAADSAAQRAGRAGRTAPGHCIRLWSKSAQLDRMTLPEIHRESLTPLVFAAAAVGVCNISNF